MSTITATFDPKLAEAAGAITFWNIGGRVSLKTLTRALGRRGIGHAPGTPTDSDRLARTVDALTSREIFKRRHVRGGFALVREALDVKAEGLPEAEDPDYNVVARVYLKPVVVKDADGTERREKRLAVDERVSGWREKVESAWSDQGDMLTADDLGEWLAKLIVVHHEAVSLRNRGGVYFVPRSSLGGWRRVAEAMAEVSTTAIHEIPAMPVKETLRAVVDSLTREASAELEGIEAELANGDLGKRAAESRSARAKAVQDKLRSYAEQMDLDVGALLEQAQKLGRSLTALILADS